MVSPDHSGVAAGTPQPPSDSVSRKRSADGGNTVESTAAKKAAMNARGAPTMRRSGTPAGFHGSMRPSLAAGNSSSFSQRGSLFQPVSGPRPLSQPTPTNFDIPAVQSSFSRGQILSPASSSVSPLLNATTSSANFQPSTEARQSLSHATNEASDSTSRLPLKVSNPVANRASQPPLRFTPQFGPAHRRPPPQSDGEQSQDSDSDDSDEQPLAYAKTQTLTFEDRLRRSQESSEVWNYIVDKLEFVNFTCKSDREREAMLEILRLPKQNELDDKPMRELDRHQRRYIVIMGSILQVVGVAGHCDACSPHYRKNWEHRKETCIGLPPEATGPEYQELIEIVAGRCSNCIRSSYRSASCNFATGDAPAQAKGTLNAAANHTPGNATPQHRVHPQRQVFTSNAQVRAPIGLENYTSGDAEAIILDTISVGLRASTQLQPQEQRGFHDWLTALLSFSSSSPGLEDQAFAALARLRQLEPGVQADIRRRILQMLPGAMGRPA